MNPIRFTVLGLAQPKGSTRMFAIRRPLRSLADVRITSDNPKVKRWQREIAKAAQLALGGAVLAITGAVQLEVGFYLPRPASHPKSADGPHTVRPDVDKLARAIADALTGIVWRDDAQITDLVARKRYADAATRARVEVTITPVALAGLPLFTDAERITDAARRSAATIRSDRGAVASRAVAG